MTIPGGPEAGQTALTSSACFPFQAIRSGLAEAQRVAGGSGTEEEKAEAQIEVQVYEALQAALKA